jgi:hypothetical protein
MVGAGGRGIYFPLAHPTGWTVLAGAMRLERMLVEVHMIRKVEGGYKVVSSKGKNLGGPYKTRAAAEKRLRQVEFFKRKG